MRPDLGAKLGLKSTGNGRRESFSYPPIPRMRNTFIEKGDVPAADVVAGTKRGIYVADVSGGGEVDVITGNFMMGVGEGYSSRTARSPVRSRERPSRAWASKP